MSELIGIDWGSSNLRAYRFGADGSVLETRQSPCGITTVADGDFESVLAALIDDWLGDHARIIMAGMIGSRNGWREATYLPCPADPHALAAALLPVPTRLGRCVIVPGLRTGGGVALADVMRGEETQLLGAGLSDGRVVLPGTHSKWATLSDGRITSIRTAMTGEIYALLLQHSLLGRLAATAPEQDDAAFALGVRRSLSDPAIMMTLFSARANVLTGELAPAAVASYLSGLLIGAEIAAMTSAGDALAMIGGAALCARYRAALALAGIEDVTTIDGDGAIAAGLWAIGREWA